MKSLKSDLQKYHADAFSMAIIHDYRIIELFTEGSVTTHTRFQAASVSKMVFTLAVLRFVAERRLSLDDDVSLYLDELCLQRPDGSLARATARQILSHTAGFNVHGFVGYSVGEKIPTTAEIILGEAPCNSPKVIQECEPGGKWNYSGGGFMVLQKCMENISGLPFADLMEKLIFQPLEMSDSTYRQDVTENLAAGYTAAGKPVPGGHHVMPEQAAAGLWTTAADLAKFGIHLQKILRGDSGLIPRELVKEMVTPHCTAVENLQAGLGTYLTTIQGTEFFGHAGDNIGFESEVNYSLQGGNGYCILVNSDEAYPWIKQMGEQIAFCFCDENRE